MSTARPAISIAIVGAGPAGLTLTRILQRNGIYPSVFEREASLKGRSQGGTLDLHQESGLQAMRDAGLMEEFIAHARLDGDVLRLQDSTGKVHFQNKSPPTSQDPESDNVKLENNPQARPEIDRSVQNLRTADQGFNHISL